MRGVVRDRAGARAEEIEGEAQVGREEENREQRPRRTALRIKRCRSEQQGEPFEPEQRADGARDAG